MANKAITRFSKRWTKALKHEKSFKYFSNIDNNKRYLLICENAPANIKGGRRYWLLTVKNS